MVGRKWLPAKQIWETRFNRSLFEVLAQYAYFVVENDEQSRLEDDKQKEDFIAAVQKDFENTSFSSAVSATTKTLEQHRIRLSILFELLNEALVFDYEIPDSIK